MHVVLVGPGALGCLLSTVLVTGANTTGDQLTLLDHNRVRAARLNKQGIIYHCGDARRTVAVGATADPQAVGHADVILLCVKSYDVVSGLAFCRSLLHPDTLLLFLQNGIGHLDHADHLGGAISAYGTTTEGATLLGPGEVRHAGSGTTSLGFLTDYSARHAALLRRTVQLFAAGGLQVASSDDILARIWTKLFVNVGINALTAINDCKNGALLTMPGAMDRMRAAIGEAHTVAQAEKIAIVTDPFSAATKVCASTTTNISSMLQDVRLKRRTEIEAINGAIVAKGRQHGIPTPENARLCAEIKHLEAAYDQPIP